MEQCGYEIDFNLYSLDDVEPQVRRPAYEHLLAIQTHVEALFSLGRPSDSVDAFNFILPALVDYDDELRAHRTCSSIYQALSVIRDARLVPTGGSPVGRPPASERLTKLVLAIAAYIETVEKVRFTVNIGRDANGRMMFLSRGAYLVRAVIDCLKLGVPDSEVATSLRKARVHFRQQNTRKPA
jgi:hypothetical protein